MYTHPTFKADKLSATVLLLIGRLIQTQFSMQSNSFSHIINFVQRSTIKFETA